MDLKTVEIAAVRPGDRLVVRCPEMLSARQREHIAEAVRRVFPMVPASDVMVLDGGLSLTIVSPDGLDLRHLGDGAAS